MGKNFYDKKKDAYQIILQFLKDGHKKDAIEHEVFLATGMNGKIFEKLYERAKKEVK